MRILITRCGQGIGAATGPGALGARGTTSSPPLVTFRLLESLDVAERLTLDVTDQRSVDAALARAGELDAVVNNAAVLGSGRRGLPARPLGRGLETKHDRRCGDQAGARPGASAGAG